jgi:hypothetical protein
VQKDCAKKPKRSGHAPGTAARWRGRRHARYRHAMTETEADQLRETVERMHGGTATLAQSVPVRETFEGQTAWEGVVHVFDLSGHPIATRAYAWSSPIEGSTKRRFFAVLHTERISSPLEAVAGSNRVRASKATKLRERDRCRSSFSATTAATRRELYKHTLF